jgi:hypothetical protein
MEGGQMAVVIPDISPVDLLGRFRGPITHAAPGYPEVVHLEVTDSEGGVWGLSTWDADYSPTDPDMLLGKTIVGADFDDDSGSLTIGFSDGSEFKVTAIRSLPEDEVENWQLFTPEGLVLNYGPAGRWRLKRAGNPC